MGQNDTDVLIIGAGPAGLATAYALKQLGIEYCVIERGKQVGYAWTQTYESLMLHTGKHFSHLPGMKFSASTPLFPSKSNLLDYLSSYVETFKLNIETDCNATYVTHTDNQWKVETSQYEKRARTLVIATGIISNPFVPAFDGQEKFSGRIMHSALYRRPQEYKGKRVLVVGIGNSAAEITVELARNGTDVTIAVRSGANVVPLKLFGVPIQYHSVLVQKLPRSVRDMMVRVMEKFTRALKGPPVLPKPSYSVLDRQPVIGFKIVNEIRKGRVKLRGGIKEFTEGGVVYEDGDTEEFDEVILATGFRSALGMFGGSISLDERGFAQRDGVISVDHPDLYFVGHNYSTIGGLRNIYHDSQLTARLIGERYAALRA
ncbi:MAG: NAD(P)/FAD-dependent oxidoreductase [Candidatus Marinimicrobia bacterium]|nr:NAD(P)/FAD-dependent oxidoreductase [Candidatus Neomarinimicrobiota bacterium]